jgi:PPP family 3-phenylpropionic acid transporter
LVASQYFIYFGVLGIFLPYFNLYCYHLGFSGFEIGALSATRSLALVLFSMLWGFLADRYRVRRPVYITCHFVSTGIWGFFLLTSDFQAMLLITAAYGVFFSPLISFLETFAVESLGDSKASYGNLRAWGSLGFIAMVVVMGRLIDARSVEVILGAIWIGSAAMAALSLAIPPAASVGTRAPSTPRTGIFRRSRTPFFLVAAFLMLVSHGTYYGFFSIHLEQLGFGKTFIGFAWALGSAAEIGVMLRSRSLFARYSLEGVLTVSFAVAAARWLVLSYATSAVSLALAQLLHAVTYGAFHMASILYMDHLSSEADKTFGQAVNNAVTYGLGLMSGFFLNGWLFDRLGSARLFAISAGIALVGGAVFFLGARRRGAPGQ